MIEFLRCAQDDRAVPRPSSLAVSNKKTPHEVGQYVKWQLLCYWFHSIGLPLLFFG